MTSGTHTQPTFERTNERFATAAASALGRSAYVVAVAASSPAHLFTTTFGGKARLGRIRQKTPSRAHIAAVARETRQRIQCRRQSAADTERKGNPGVTMPPNSCSRGMESPVQNTRADPPPPSILHKRLPLSVPIICPQTFSKNWTARRSTENGAKSLIAVRDRQWLLRQGRRGGCCIVRRE